jgi:hypothetical protein
MLSILAVVATTGCATITASTKTAETVVGTRQEKSTSNEPLYVTQVALSPEANRDSLVVDIAKAKRCTTVDVKDVHRVQRTTRSTDGSIGTEYLLGAVGVAAGGTAVGFAASGKNGWGDTGIDLGLVAGGLGVLFLTGGVVDTFRVQDSTDDLGVTTQRGQPDTQPCQQQPAANTEFTLTVGAERMPGKTDTNGSARVPVRDIREILGRSAVGFEHVPATVSVEGQDTTVTDVLTPLVEQLRQERQQQARAERAREFDDEVRTGKCTDRHASELQGVLQQTKMIFDQIGSGHSTDWFTSISSDILVATPDGARVPQDSFLGGEFHIFAVSREPVTLDVRDARGNRAGMQSLWERALGGIAAGGSTDSRVLQANTLQDVTIRLKGHGCAIVAVFVKH